MKTLGFFTFKLVPVTREPTVFSLINATVTFKRTTLNKIVKAIKLANKLTLLLTLKLQILYQKKSARRAVDQFSWCS